MLVAVVCDGAGSAREGRTASDFIARALAEQLSSTLHAGPERLTEVQAEGSARLERDHPTPPSRRVRTRLADLAASRELALHDFSCTLVGCVASRGGGCFFHVGDGFAIQQGPAGDTVLSRPENGEYADETYFVTDENWKDHLRLTPLAAPERGAVIGLMSDGTAPFAVNRARSGFFRPFIDPIAALSARGHGAERQRSPAQSAGEPAGLRNLGRRQDPAARLRPLTGDPASGSIPCPPSNASLKTSSSSSGRDAARST